MIAKVDTQRSQDEPAAANSRKELQLLLSAYIGQLHDGCGNAQCTQPLCYTGRCNIEDRPTRRYTLTSARIIAFSACFATEPRSNLCKYFDRTSSGSDDSSLLKERYDVSSLTQAISNSVTFRQVKQPDSLLNLKLSSRVAELNELHRQFDSLRGLDISEMVAGVQMSPTSEIVEASVRSMLWLLKQASPDDFQAWNTIIPPNLEQRALTSTDEMEIRRKDAFTHIVDVLNHPPYLSLLCRIAVAVVSRRTIELEILKVRPDSKVSRVLGLVFRQLREKASAWSPIYLYTLAMWLVNCFSMTWDEEPIIRRATKAAGALIMIKAAYAHCRTQQYLQLRMAIEMKMEALFNEVDDFRAARTWLEYARGDRKDQHIYLYTFLISPGQVLKRFRTVNYLLMRFVYSRDILELPRLTTSTTATKHSSRRPSQACVENQFPTVMIVRHLRSAKLKNTTFSSMSAVKT